MSEKSFRAYLIENGIPVECIQSMIVIARKTRRPDFALFQAAMRQTRQSSSAIEMWVNRRALAG